MPNVLSPRDLVSRFDNMDETVPHTVSMVEYTPQPLYNTVRYNTVLDITLISIGPQMFILN